MENNCKDIQYNGEFYPPVINMKQLTKLWKRKRDTVTQIVKALLLMGVPIGDFEGREWFINTRVAIESYENGRVIKSIRAIKEGRVPRNTREFRLQIPKGEP